MAKVDMTIDEIKNIFTSYYDTLTFATINDRLRRRLKKAARQIADELVKEVMSQYDFKQEFRQLLEGPDERIIVTSILTRKKKKNAKKS